MFLQVKEAQASVLEPYAGRSTYPHHGQRVVMAFEENFGIEIPDEDAEKIATVKDAVDYIEKHAKGK
ncbi:MAG: DUF2252 family protein [Candidatus Acidiferrales bacterium]